MTSKLLNKNLKMLAVGTAIVMLPELSMASELDLVVGGNAGTTIGIIQSRGGNVQINNYSGVLSEEAGPQISSYTTSIIPQDINSKSSKGISSVLSAGLTIVANDEATNVQITQFGDGVQKIIDANTSVQEAKANLEIQTKALGDLQTQIKTLQQKLPLSDDEKKTLSQLRKDEDQLIASAEELGKKEEQAQNKLTALVKDQRQENEVRDKLKAIQDKKTTLASELSTSDEKVKKIEKEIKEIESGELTDAQKAEVKAQFDKAEAKTKNKKGEESANIIASGPYGPFTAAQKEYLNQLTVEYNQKKLNEYEAEKKLLEERVVNTEKRLKEYKELVQRDTAIYEGRITVSDKERQTAINRVISRAQNGYEYRKDLESSLSATQSTLSSLKPPTNVKIASNAVTDKLINTDNLKKELAEEKEKKSNTKTQLLDAETDFKKTTETLNEIKKTSNYVLNSKETLESERKKLEALEKSIEDNAKKNNLTKEEFLKKLEDDKSVNGKKLLSNYKEQAKVVETAEKLVAAVEQADKKYVAKTFTKVPVPPEDSGTQVVVRVKKFSNPELITKPIVLNGELIKEATWKPDPIADSSDRKIQFQFNSSKQ